MRVQQARYALLALVSLATFLTVGLGIALFAYGLADYHSILAICRLAWSEIVDHGVWPMLTPLLVLLLMGGSAVVALVRQLVATRRLHLRLAPLLVNTPSTVVEATQRLGIAGRVDVVYSDAPLIFCYGVLKPRVCLATGLLGLLDDEELTAILLHERHHLLRHDPLGVLASRSLAAAVGILPVARQLVARYLLARELDADYHAIETLGSGAPLASAILKLNRTRSQWRLGQAAVSSLNVTHERVVQLLTGTPGPLPHPTRRATLSTLAIVALIFTASFAPLLLLRESTELHTHCDPVVSLANAPFLVRAL